MRLPFLEPAAGALSDGARFAGYEMHVGRTDGDGVKRPFVHFDDGREDGAVSPCGRIMGTYVHGLFASDAARTELIPE